MYAIAFDLGTTTLAASLVDTSTGERKAASGSMNPQRAFGADVVSRLEAAVQRPEAAVQMTGLIREELARLAGVLIKEAGLAEGQAELAAVAGNPAMEHLLLGWPVESLARPPFRPKQTGGITISAADLGWDFCHQVYVFPQPGGFVGGDTVAFMFGCRQVSEIAPALYLDMGTNGEMVLDDGNQLWATSAAAGPAFEGGNLTCGMAALDGAIVSFDTEGGRLKAKWIGSGTPKGICGSAALNAVVLMLGEGLLEKNGRIVPPGESSSVFSARVEMAGDEAALVIYRDASRTIRLTQSDIRQIQLAKGAIRAGLDVLSERSCIHYEALRDVVVTGSFGAVLTPDCLKTIGIFTPDMVKNARFVREGALAGVEASLTVPAGFSAVEALAQRFRVVPLSGTPLFERNFLKNIDFP